MSFELHINDSQLRAAIQEIEAATGRDMATILNDLGRDVAMTAVQQTKAASKQEIQNLQNKYWWPKYVAKRLAKKAVTIGLTRRVKLASGQEAPFYVDPSTKRAMRYKVSMSRGGNSKMRSSSYGQYFRQRFQKSVGGGAHYTRQEARAVSKRIINARVRTINFIRAGFLPAARAFASASGRTDLDLLRGKNYEYGVAKGSAVLARPGESPVAILINSACSDGKHSTSKTGDAALVRHGGEGLQKAVNIVGSRELTWAANKLQQTFNRFMGI